VRTSYEYDGLNRLVSVVENDTGGAPTHDSNVLTQYVYDALGNRVVITNALGYTSTRTTYDALGRPVVVQDALGHQTLTRYNALGYRTVVTDAIPPGGTQADGAVTRYSYRCNYLSRGNLCQDSKKPKMGCWAGNRRTKTPSRKTIFCAG
jgi:YD repeat-containing protein